MSSRLKVDPCTPSDSSVWVVPVVFLNEILWHDLEPHCTVSKFAAPTVRVWALTLNSAAQNTRRLDTQYSAARRLRRIVASGPRRKLEELEYEGMDKAVKSIVKSSKSYTCCVMRRRVFKLRRQGLIVELYHEYRPMPFCDNMAEDRV